MSRSESIKQQLGYMKLWIGACIAVIISLIGWLAVNYDRTEMVLNLGAGFGITGVIADSL